MSAKGTLFTKCSICLNPTPKYRCPRCSARSCSLACVQTHKARNLCSGVRDAATYLSKKQLANPAAFDSDFNLLSGIERGVERAGRIFDGNDDHDKRSRDKEKALSRAFEASGVKVLRAPKGVIRRKENGTYVDGRRRCLHWTIEWKFMGIRTLSLASELGSVQEAHDIAALEAFSSETDKIKKSKLKDYVISTGVKIPLGHKGRQGLIQELGISSEASLTSTPVDNDKLESGMSGPTVDDPHPTAAEESPITISQSGSQIDSSRPFEAGATASDLIQRDSASETAKMTAETKPDNTTRRFFLHRPEVSTAQKQIICQLDGKSIVRDVLRGKTVREFPTILVEIAGQDEIDWTQWHQIKETDTFIVD